MNSNIFSQTNLPQSPALYEIYVLKNAKHCPLYGDTTAWGGAASGSSARYGFETRSITSLFESLLPLLWKASTFTLSLLSSCLTITEPITNSTLFCVFLLHLGHFIQPSSHV